MLDLTEMLICTVSAGACIPLGGALAKIEKIRPRWLDNELRHFVIAFGGGILLAAVALVLVPEGVAYMGHPILSVVLLLFGGAAFFMLESFLGSRRREKPQFTAMLLDYIPESLALGGAFAIGAPSAPLLALFIGLQNLPEGFNAYRELRSAEQFRDRNILGFMGLLVPIGPVIGLTGWTFFSEDVRLLGATMLFASGGILYLIFQDIAPQSRMQRHWAPPLGAVLGFCAGMLGNNLLY
jgi:ZIP family zinc transporter